MIEELIKERKKLGLSARRMEQLTGYSKVWFYKVDSGERRFSKKFLEAYKKAIDGYKKLING